MSESNKMKLDMSLYETYMNNLSEKLDFSEINTILDNIEICCSDNKGNTNMNVIVLNAKLRKTVNVLKELMEETYDAMGEKYNIYFDTEKTNEEYLSYFTDGIKNIGNKLKNIM